jgi:predicted amidohydrolase
MPRPLRIAVAQPSCEAGDPAANAREHARAVREARAQVVVFPELSLTGYELDAGAVSPADDVLAPIVDACAKAGAIALVGAPVACEDGHEYIATLRVGGEGADVAYRKMWLGGEEPDRFTPGPEPAVVDVDGWRLGLGICKDTGVAEHVDVTAALGIDVYVAGLVHLPEELEVQEARALRIARRSGAHVAFASFAGPTGGGYDRTAGHSGIWSPAGAVLAQADTTPGAVARATLG